MYKDTRNFLQIIGLLAIAVIGLIVLKPGKNNSNSEKRNTISQKVAELITADLSKTSEGFILYPVVGTAEIQLLNMHGEKVHIWTMDAQRARLLPNCNLLVVHGSKWGTNVEPWKTLKFELREYDWDGELVWNYKAPGRVHHDVAILSNGNKVFPYRTTLSMEKQSTITDPRRRSLKNIRSDSIIEVTNEGEIVWEWHAEDHLDVNSCGKHNCEGESPSDWSHINTVSVIPENQWYDQGDERFRPGNILTLLRNWWTALIIDKQTGAVVWRYTGDYKGGLSGGHEASMIPKGLSGGGNILIFDNGRSLHKGESYILEIDPTTKKLSFVYDDGKALFSNSAGSVQRLPNGNTFISEDLQGRVFEITPEKETVWEYKGKKRIARAKKYPTEYCPKLSQLQLK